VADYEARIFRQRSHFVAYYEAVAIAESKDMSHGHILLFHFPFPPSSSVVVVVIVVIVRKEVKVEARNP